MPTKSAPRTTPGAVAQLAYLSRRGYTAEEISTAAAGLNDRGQHRRGEDQPGKVAPDAVSLTQCPKSKARNAAAPAENAAPDARNDHEKRSPSRDIPRSLYIS